MAKVHLISDSSLGDIQREYVEVGGNSFRKGDYAVYKGNVSEVTYANCDILSLDGRFHLHADTVTKLAPTDIVQVDGERFRMVERKAAVGERVVVTEDRTWYKAGDVFTVTRVDFPHPAVGGDVGNVVEGYYRVLVPVESVPITVDTTQASPQVSVEVDESQASPQVVEMLANLAQRIVALESQVADLKSRESVNTLARDLAEFIAKEARKNGKCGR